MFEQNYDYSKYTDDQLVIEYHKLTEKIESRIWRNKKTMSEEQIKTNMGTLDILEKHLSAVIAEMRERAKERNDGNGNKYVEVGFDEPIEDILDLDTWDEV